MTTTTSVTTPTANQTADGPRPLPLWASIPIVLACLAMGGWIISWYVGSRVRADEAHVLGDMPTRPANPSGGGGGGWFAGLRRYVRLQRPSGGERGGERTVYDAGTEQATLTWSVNNNGGGGGPGGGRRPLSLNQVSYGPNERALTFLPEDVRRTVAAARQLATSDNKAAEALKLTPEQVGKLKQLGGRFSMTLSDADRTLLLADMAAYVAAPPAAQEGEAKTKLLADLDAVAERSKPATIKTAADRAAKINSIVTPEQWTQYKAMGGRP
jgi:hypothetical protein